MSITAYPAHPLLDLLRKAEPGPAARFSGRPGLSYRELEVAAAGLAGRLREWGVEPSARVALLLRNSPEALVALAACWSAGAVPMPLNARWRPPELASALEAARPALLLTEAPRRPGLLARARAAAPAGLPVVVLEHGRPVTAPAVRAPRAPLGSAEVGLVLHTSGTSARPRACLLGARRLAANAQAAAARFGFSAGERLWNPLPLYHVGGLLPWLALASVGGCLLSAARFQPAPALRLMRRHRATFAYPMFPHIFEALVDDAAFDPGDLATLRAFIQVAPRPQLRRAQRRLPAAAEISAYGSTEAGAVAFGDPRDPEPVRLDSCGRPLAGVEVRVADGELLVRGASLLLGWLGETASPVDEQGWFHTGDAGELDPEGRVRYHGRLTDALKVGGENVAPAEVEACLLGHPAVRQAVVVGLRHPRLGQVPAAAVELRPGAAARPEELLAHCRAGLAAFKVPVRVRIVRRWPMSATKIRREAVRELLAAPPERRRPRAG